MKVKEIMTQDVKTCGADETMSAVVQVMWDNDCGIVPIVDDEGALLGVMTDRDVAVACWSRDARPSELRVGETMSRNLVVCAPDDTVAAAEQLLERSQVRRLPVTNARGALVGLLSLNDIARAAARARTAKRKSLPSTRFVETIAGICRPRTPARHAPAVVKS